MPREVDPFAGTARYYSQFRPGYPTSVFDLLTLEAPLKATSKVLDLGCGTGHVALRLAERVASVTGVDLDQGMLDEASRLADERGQRNLRWVLSSAERFEDEPGSYQLVVIGSAFHWMDRPIVAARAHRMLQHKGLFALLGNPSPLAQIQRREGVGAAVADVQDRWIDLDERDWQRRLARPEEVISASPFRTSTVLSVPTRQEWDVPTFVGFLRSTSFRPDQVLGSRFQQFADEIAAAVLSVEPTGQWVYEDSVEVILARR
jgi:ubiquinone/menaquinone biosynthesis C-methylase UbiE